jgi:peptidoglycan/LPS O-acetylase OafA/YrhL
LALSGYFAAKSLMNLSHDIKKYWHARFLRILSPYLFWTVVFISFKTPSSLLSITVLGKDILLGTGIGIGYYVIVLVQYILLTPFILKIKKARNHIIIMMVFTCGGLIINYSLRTLHSGLIFGQFPYYALAFFTWYPFYHLGIFVQQQGFVDKPFFSIQAPKFIVFYLFFVFTSIIEALILSSKGLTQLACSQIKITSFLASISLFLFSAAYHGVAASRTKDTILSWMGQNTYPIYLMHLLFFPVIGSLLKHVSMPCYIQAVNIFLQIIIVISICSFIILVAKTIVPHKLRTLCLGI